MGSRNIYLIRHGRPAYPDDSSFCIGTTDFPLSPVGRMQAVLLGTDLSSVSLQGIYASPLSRSRETAAILADTRSVKIIPDLRERSMGEWDGLPFSLIRTNWPDIYERRGEDPDFPVPGEETLAASLRRFQSALRQILASSSGDIAIVSHTDVISSFAFSCAGAGALPVGHRRQYRLPCGSYYIFTVYDGDLSAKRSPEDCPCFDSIQPDLTAHRPRPEMSEDLCRALRRAADLPLPVQAHCDAVASSAIHICDVLAGHGYHFNRRLILYGAMLHDIARLQHNHAETGGKWLTDLGYPDVGHLIACHNDLPDCCLDEAAILFIADKITRGTSVTTLEERFGESLSKCRTPEARKAHRRRQLQAFRMREHINTLCGQEVIRLN